MNEVNLIEIPRSYIPISFADIESHQIHVFCDASKNAISYVMYLRTVDNIGLVNVSFLLANSKVSPRMATSIPRLELCAAVEAVLAAKGVTNELSIDSNSVNYYTDSQVLLGYLYNEDKHFTKYVSLSLIHI